MHRSVSFLFQTHKTSLEQGIQGVGDGEKLVQVSWRCMVFTLGGFFWRELMVELLTMKWRSKRLQKDLNFSHWHQHQHQNLSLNWRGTIFYFGCNWFTLVLFFHFHFPDSSSWNFCFGGLPILLSALLYFVKIILNLG